LPTLSLGAGVGDPYSYIHGLSDGRSSPATLSEPSSFKQSPPYDAIRFLRFLLMGIVVVPLALAIIGGYVTYQDLLTRTEKTLVQSVAAAAENTIKVLDTHRLAAARIDDLLAPLSDQQIHNQEQALHQALSQQIKDLPQIAAAWVLDADGRELVSAKVYPVNGNLKHSNREDFQALRNSGGQIFISALRARSLEHDDFRPYFTVARGRQGADGQFRGITIVAISGTYLASFFNSLLGNPHAYAAGILGDDGVNLARYPGNSEGPSALQHSDPLAHAIASGSSAGLIVSASLFESDDQIIAYQKVGNYPVYVSLTRTAASVRQEWLLAIGGYLAIATAAVLGLVLLCLIALRRARREHTALAQATSLLHDRETAYAALHAAKEEVDDANQAKSNFLATMSHELRTPLNAIIGFSEMMMHEAFGPIGNKKYEGYIADIHNSGSHLLHVISDILDLSKASAGKFELDEAVFDLQEVLRSVNQITGGLVHAAKLRLDVRIWGNLPWVRGDQRKIAQVLLNLVNNSIKFTPAGGKITLAARFDPSQGVVVTVSDTGLGIAPEDLDRVMKPFEQVASPLNRRHQGTGLGLPFVKEIVEQHNGRLELNSELDAGTTVSVILPLERTAVRPLPSEQDMSH